MKIFLYLNSNVTFLRIRTWMCAGRVLVTLDVKDWFVFRRVDAISFIFKPEHVIQNFFVEISCQFPMVVSN